MGLGYYNSKYLSLAFDACFFSLFEIDQRTIIPDSFKSFNSI